MRARNLKPGFFKNEELAGKDPLARLLFEGLWCMADREGRLEDRAARIKAEILPYDNCDVESLLTSLASGDDPFILRYEADGRRYIQVIHFIDHQNPHFRESKSKIPAPEKPKLSFSSARCKPWAGPGQALGKPEASPGPSPGMPETRLSLAQDKPQACPVPAPVMPETSPRPALGKPGTGAADSPVHDYSNLSNETSVDMNPPEISGHLVTNALTPSPAWCNPEASPGPAPGQPEIGPGPARGKNSTSPADSLIPDSLIPDSSSLSKDKPPSAPADINATGISPSVQKSSSRHFLTHIEDTALREEIKKTAETIKTSGFNPYRWCQAKFSEGKFNPRAILHTLNRIAKEQCVVKDLWPYAEKVYAVEYGNCNEREHIERSRAYKGDFSKKELASIGSILADLAKPP